jgi:hypothetical protein
VWVLSEERAANPTEPIRKRAGCETTFFPHSISIFNFFFDFSTFYLLNRATKKKQKKKKEKNELLSPRD